ncbi:sugar transporter [Moniliophthora roreri]|nr:sugar transporter [Moniliophthora roreri]
MFAANDRNGPSNWNSAITGDRINPVMRGQTLSLYKFVEYTAFGLVDWINGSILKHVIQQHQLLLPVLASGNIGHACFEGANVSGLHWE